MVKLKVAVVASPPRKMTREQLLVKMIASRRSHRKGIRHLIYKWWLDERFPLGEEVSK